MSDPFELQRPEPTRAIPVLVGLPHCAVDEPSEVTQRHRLSPNHRQRDVDLYTDALWGDALALGATVLRASWSRWVVDLNRAPDEIDAGSVEDAAVPAGTHRRGLVWQVTAAGEPSLAAPWSAASFTALRDDYWAPYHAVLRRELDRLASRFGVAVLLDGHSMPSVGRGDHTDSGRRRADIVPGDNHGRTCSARLASALARHFTDLGYSVARNDPYRGGWITRHYAAPRRRQPIHAVQIEVNRDLYMVEDTFERRTEGFARLRCALAGAVEVAAAFAAS